MSVQPLSQGQEKFSIKGNAAFRTDSLQKEAEGQN